MSLFWITRILAVAIALLLVPLYLDLVVALAGNLLCRRRRQAEPVREIRLIALVPAHDEELHIAQTVASLLKAGFAATQAAPGGDFLPRVFVVAHNCSDATAERAAEAGAEVVRIDDAECRGKGAALRAGFCAARAAGANAFLVVDADSIASPNLREAMARALARGQQAAQCRYELELPAETGLFSLARLRVLAFRGINVLRSRGRARWGLSAGLFGNGFAVTAEALERVPFAVDSICEDLEYHVHLVCAGLRVGWVEETAVYAPLSRPGATQARQEARWEGGRFRVAALATRPLLRALLRGNLCALGLLAEAWSLPLARGVLVVVLAVLLPVPWLRMIALGCLLLTVAYVLGAALIGPAPARDLAALSLAPVHILWKLALTPLVVFQTRRRAAWTRTAREAERP